MRLWHEKLIPHLPRQQLLGQHRECCALRGLGWGKPHSVVNYVFNHPYGWLVAYHYKVMNEMIKRGYEPDEAWDNTKYRGKKAPALKGSEGFKQICEMDEAFSRSPVYPEHDEAYLRECLENLAQKGIYIDRSVIQ